MKKGFTLWFTGLPSSGKSTIADAVAQELKKSNLQVERLDGDAFRKTFSSDLSFSAEDIKKNNERVISVSKSLTEKGMAVLVSLISPYRQSRENARKEIGDFVEVYVKCPLEECKKRDPKGNYKKALAGEIPNFIGISSPYEEPESPEVIIETDKEDVAQCAQKIIATLKKLGYLG